MTIPRATPGPNSYTTLAAGPDFRHEISIKRSRFITVLRRVGDEPSARELLAGLRREFYDARHHCSAFVIGADRAVQRSNDDGEPSGTAGTPMLDALLKREARPAASPRRPPPTSATCAPSSSGILAGSCWERADWCVHIRSR